MAPARLVSGYEGTVANLLDDVNAALNGTGRPSRNYLSQLSRYEEYVNLSFRSGID